MLTPLALLSKARSHLGLLKNDPEKFGSNLLQITNPARFQEKLVDMLAMPPLQLRVDATLKNTPALNVLQPVLSPAVMTGGPNTVVNLAHWIARQGVAVRIVTTHTTSAADLAWFWQHLASLTGEADRPPSLSVVAAGDSDHPAVIGPRDMFLATHWTTAQQLKKHLPRMEVKRFFYLIQDFEPGFYAWSSNYALAMETYGLDHIGIFNEQLLHDYFVAQSVGLYASPDFAATSIVFEPAVDRTHFHPPSRARIPAKRRLLYYARPSNPRNMLGLGLAALRAALADAAFGRDAWEILAIGGNNSLPPIALGNGHVLEPAQWANYSAYGRLLRESDILLCPMFSPHTSYPVLEMAASGGITVTNTFATKTAAKLQHISANIIAAPPTEEGLAQGLIQAAIRVLQGVDPHTAVNLKTDWNAALSATAVDVARVFRHTTAHAYSQVGAPAA